MIAWLLGMGTLFAYIVIGLWCLDLCDASRATSTQQQLEQSTTGKEDCER